LNTYSIRDLEQLSGIKAHTLRIWEQRYSVLSPQRSATNIRYYNGEDLKRVLNISLLNSKGYRISSIAKMSVAEIKTLVEGLNEDSANLEAQEHKLIKATVELDEQLFEKVISNQNLVHGFKHTMLKLVYPFLEKIGMMWLTGSITPCQEHFITNLIRQKLIVAVDGQVSVANEKTKKVVVFAPEGDYHELGLLFAQYLLKQANHSVMYLGANTPIKGLKEVVELFEPDYVFCKMTSTMRGKKGEKYVEQMVETFSGVDVCIGGVSAGVIQDLLTPNFIVVSNMNGFLTAINNV